MEPIDGRLTRVEILWEQISDKAIFPFSVPSIAGTTDINLDRQVTFLIGENGSGKSTLIEAIAIAAGMNPEGGSGKLRFSTKSSHSHLHEHLRVTFRGRPKRTFFLRAESFYNVASKYDVVLLELPSLHELSHGESFLEAIARHFGPKGLFLLDEPESALSVRGQLQLLRHIYDATAQGSQFLVSTHSPILLAYPGAQIYEISENGPTKIDYAETNQYQLTKAFLDAPEAFFRYLFSDDETDVGD